MFMLKHCKMAITYLRCNLIHGFIHGLASAWFMCNKAFNLIQLYQLFAWPILSYVKWWSPTSSPDVLEGKSVVKRIDLLGTDDRDVHYPTDEPNPTHVESSGWGKFCPHFFKPAQRFGAKIVSPRTPHGTSECFDPTLVWNPWATFDETKQSYWTKFLEFGMALNPTQSI